MRLKQTLTIVTKDSMAARYDGAIKILIWSLFCEKMAMRKDAHAFPLLKDARLDFTAASGTLQVLPLHVILL